MSVLPQVPLESGFTHSRGVGVGLYSSGRCLGCDIQGEVLLENALLCRVVFTVPVAERQRLPVSPALESLFQSTSCSCLLLNSQQPTSQCVASSAIYNKG